MRKTSPTAWLLLAIVLLFGWRHLHRDPASAPAAAAPAAAATTSASTTAAVASPPSATPAATPTRATPAIVPVPTDLPAFLPPEARAVITRIQRGGTFPHPQDGSPFGNYEGHLPRQPRGWYHEYTVPTPGLSHRGTRRIVTGGTPPQVWYYSADHYRSFRRFDVQDPRP